MKAVLFIRLIALAALVAGALVFSLSSFASNPEQYSAEERESDERDLRLDPSIDLSDMVENEAPDFGELRYPVSPNINRKPGIISQTDDELFGD